MFYEVVTNDIYSILYVTQNDISQDFNFFIFILLVEKIIQVADKKHDFKDQNYSQRFIHKSQRIANQADKPHC